MRGEAAVNHPLLLPAPHATRTRRDGPLHVVLVDEELPYPANSGKRIRTLNLTLRLARRHRLTYVCHRNADPDEARAAAAFFVENGVVPVVVDRAVPARSGPPFYLRLAANLLSPLPYSVATHRSRALRRALRRLAAAGGIDLWHCEWTPYAASLRGLAGPRLVVAHNVESVIWQRYAEAEPGPLRRWYIRRQWHKWRRFEAAALGAVERTVAVSDVDAARLREDFGVSRIDVVENGVDTAHFHPQGGPREPGRLLFLGSLDWRPNLDGVGQLLDRVFPAVRAREPSARLCLVGRNPPAALRRRAASTPGVELHADVPDVRPSLATCSLLVVPLRIAGGSRLKILEALACGTPVVSTRVGAEGLCLEPGRHLSVVEGVDDLPAAIVSALRAPAAARDQAERGREEVLRRYDWEQLAARLEEVWMECARPSATRHGDGVFPTFRSAAA
jgi:glycosyltransferase involved in cell wall biosynthesis